MADALLADADAALRAAGFAPRPSTGGLVLDFPAQPHPRRPLTARTLTVSAPSGSPAWAYRLTCHVVGRAGAYHRQFVGPEGLVAAVAQQESRGPAAWRPPS